VNEKNGVFSFIIIIFCILSFAGGFFIGRNAAFGNGSAAAFDGNRNGTGIEYQRCLENERIVIEVREGIENCTRELDVIRGGSEGTIEKVERLRIIVKELAAYRDFFNRVQHSAAGWDSNGSGN
jgi:hypothetical protein